MMMTTSPLQLFEPTPSVTFSNPHADYVNAFVELKDGSFLSCSNDFTAKRWLRTTTNNLELLGTYQGHQNAVCCAMEKDDDTLITGSIDNTLKVWSTTTCECLDTLPVGSAVFCLLKTNDKSRFFCGLLGGGRVELRRVSDLGVLSYFTRYVWRICELEDGSFVSVSWKTMTRWDENNAVLQIFSGHSDVINGVIALNRDVIVSASKDTTVKMWKVSTGVCLRTLILHSDNVRGLEKVNDGVFASGSVDGRIVVWNEKGDCIETHQSNSQITAMTILRDGSIVTADKYLIEVRQR